MNLLNQTLIKTQQAPSPVQSSFELPTKLASKINQSNIGGIDFIIIKIVKSVNGQKVVLNTSNSLTQHSKDATMDNEKKVNKLAKKTIDRDL